MNEDVQYFLVKSSCFFHPAILGNTGGGTLKNTSDYYSFFRSCFVKDLCVCCCLVIVSTVGFTFILRARLEAMDL